MVEGSCDTQPAPVLHRLISNIISYTYRHANLDLESTSQKEKNMGMILLCSSLPCSACLLLLLMLYYGTAMS